MKKNIVLIGLPGSGKSTIGQSLSSLLGLNFIDTDEVIEQYINCSLQDYIKANDHFALRSVEEKILLNLEVNNHIISTGGSAIYSERSMQLLKQNGIFVYLEIGFETMSERIHDYSERGLAKSDQQSLEEMYLEREALYKRYTDISIDNNSDNIDAVSKTILLELGKVN